MAKTLEQLRQQFANKSMIRCMGRCHHPKGTCTADKDCQRYMKLEKETQ